MLIRRFKFIWLALALFIFLLVAGVVPLRGAGTVVPVIAAPVGETEAGRLVYEQRCAGCHGVEGDGNGPAAERLYPRPRDFRRGLYKVRTTGSGQLPTDDDLFHIVTNGMPGTAMPGWEDALTPQQRREVITYIKTFSRRFARGSAPQPITFGEAIPLSQESIARGRELYFGPLECFQCHGQEGRGDGPSALDLEDDFGFSILPANLTKNWNFRGGETREDIARTFLTGLLGTPMPSYEGQMTEEDSWHLANFVRSLSPPKKPKLRALLTAHRTKESLPTSPGDPRWSPVESYTFPLIGQITQAPRNFTPTLDAITVRALYNDEELAILLTWDDRSESRVVGEGRTVDSVAIQFPVQTAEGSVRPYFLEGEPGRPVNLWRWQADTEALEELNATGLGTGQLQDTDSQALAGEAVYEDGQWRLVLRRSLITPNAEEDTQFELDRFIPIAFSAWEGQNGEVETLRAVSNWYLLYLAQPTGIGDWLQVPGRIAVVGGLEGAVLWWAWRRRRTTAATSEQHT